jgi:7-carboxy-7-deazaguanine synthase
MKVAEIFYSVQGEGGLVGTPSAFVRLSGCNLRCAWCDTRYASWRPEGRRMSVEAVVDAVMGFKTRHVVLTGGEPMIFPELAPLTQALRGLGCHITIETAGTVWAPVACDLMSISPKLSNSAPRAPRAWASRHERLRLQPEVLKRLMTAYPYQLKFVVARPSDLAEINTLVEALGADPARVILMPEGTRAATLRRRGLWLVERCKQAGYRFSPRLHIDLYGHRRGV